MSVLIHISHLNIRYLRLLKSHIKVITAQHVTHGRQPCPTDISDRGQQKNDGGLSKAVQPTQRKYKASSYTSAICPSAAAPLSDV